ncbi:MAG: dTDP-4-dehydrorhamnose 3,5-epimerase family protein [Candidatus Marinimicrobia bacterium]|nr:dTDP-4-dehydrorhamnose 3,5-epimerase family protein [Candidatus Neomarinimicrobiota bacterium]
MKLTDDARSSLCVQDYSPKPIIDGVKIINLRRFNDGGGSLTELGRLTAGILDAEDSFTVAQINYSEMDAGVIKAFHIHEKQTDIWYVPPTDKLILVLADQRSESVSSGMKMKLVLGDCKSQLVLIPPGVAHGCKNPSSQRSRIIYFVSQKFTPDVSECDEKRLPWDFFGREIWETPRE